MSIQAQMNQILIDNLPAIKNLINKAERFEANQMMCLTFRYAMESSRPVDDMNEVDLLNFQLTLIRRFEFNGWVQPLSK